MTAANPARKTVASRQRAESVAKKGVVEFKGRSFTIPTDPDKVPFEALEAMEDGRVVEFSKQMLGAKQYSVLRPLLATAADLNAFYTLVQESMQLPE